MPASDELQDQEALLDAQNKPKKPKKRFVYKAKTLDNRREGFLPSDFPTSNPG